jgi:hypothetical protein
MVDMICEKAYELLTSVHVLKYIYDVSWPKLFRFVATPWGIDFLWFNAQYLRCSITTNSSQAKNLPNTEKMGDQ